MAYTGRRIALTVSYVGNNYFGSALSVYRKSSAIPTISGELLKALSAVGAIPNDRNALNLRKHSLFSAASRTDKGVHAAGNVFSLKMEKENFNSFLSDEDGDDQLLTLKSQLNASLPTDICVQSIVATTQGFDARYKAQRRVYRYLCPTYLFDANFDAAQNIPNIECKFYQSMMQKNAHNDDDKYEDELLRFAQEMLQSSSTQHGDDARFAYRMNAELLRQVRDYCQIYIGHRNYHNFTRKVEANEGAANRNIFSADVCGDEDDALIVVDGVEYVQFEFCGNAFLYHQIRQMVGFIVVLMRNMAYQFVHKEQKLRISDPDNTKLISFALSDRHKMVIPLAPSQGLYLTNVHFDEYNDKCDRDDTPQKKVTNESIQAELDTFIADKIMPRITGNESDEFAFWLYALPYDYNYQVIEIDDSHSAKQDIDAVECSMTHVLRNILSDKMKTNH